MALGGGGARAAVGEAVAMPGLAWGIPFAGLLVSIALVPALAPRLWHRRAATITAGWVAALLVPYAVAFGTSAMSAVVLHAALLEYIPFMALIGGLYVVAGGIALRGNLHGSPATNTALLAIGTGLASVIGTTGASILLIRPLLRANDDRVHKTHVFVFFIFLVANIGGALTPLGDPPLFIGFLKGVDFFWPAANLAKPVLFLVVVLLGGFYLYDRHVYAREGHLPVDPTPDSAGLLRVEGARNFLFLGGMIAAVLMTGLLPELGHVMLFGQRVALVALLRDATLVGLAVASLLVTPRSYRRANRFGWAPLVEVAVLFAGIFVTIAPVIAMLQAGADGPMGGLIARLSGPDGQPDAHAYFWLTGLLTSFLDNAPTYLIFFNAAGGDAAVLMGPLRDTLVAISMAAVFMGANTYIGNAPNFMIRAIAVENGVPMPSFIGYMAWSGVCLLPLFALIAILFL